MGWHIGLKINKDRIIRRLFLSSSQKPSTLTPSQDDFAALLDETMPSKTSLEGQVITGRITSLESGFAVIDIGLKTEGRIPVEEFDVIGQKANLSVGDEVEVYLERIENIMGEAMISREKARHEQSWVELEKMFADDKEVEGVIVNRVKGGFIVDIAGAVSFLPGSQVDVRPVRDMAPLMHTPMPFKILKIDKKRGNIVVSRRAIMEKMTNEDRNKIVQNLVEGQVTEGVVKNITDYGAFIDMGGIDGLLHVTDISWQRIGHPSEALTVGEMIAVKVIKINYETMRVNLGMKQLADDPWHSIQEKFPVNVKLKGRVTNITDYGAFVELENGIEGLIHVSQMSWVKKNIHPGKIVSTSQEVEVMVLDVDVEKRRVSLGLKQCIDNPWESFAEKYEVNTKIKGEIRNITEFGLFVDLDGDIDGMIHVSDLSWTLSHEEAVGKFQKGQEVEALILSIDVDKERISLGIKQLESDPMQNLSGMKRNETVTCVVIAINDGGVEVSVGEGGMNAFIRRSDLARDRSDQRPDRFAVGDKLDAMITSFDSKSRRISLSVKALEIAEEKEAVAQYGSSGSGASLGDILGAVLEQQEDKDKNSSSEEDNKQGDDEAKEVD